MRTRPCKSKCCVEQRLFTVNTHHSPSRRSNQCSTLPLTLALTLVVSDLTLFYNPNPKPNTKSNSKSNPNRSSHRFVWRDMPFTLKMYDSPFAPARVTRSRKTKHMHKHYS